MPVLNWDFMLRFFNIALIDIALSGDNAIVIGMAAASLPREKRKWAIILGGGLAVILRIILTSIATLLMLIPYLSAIGGVVLVWVVYKLLKLDVAPEGEADHTKQASNLRQALVLILAADVMMSVDNVIAVAGSAHGSIFLLIAGLLLSMPLLMTTGGFISMLIDKAKWLVYVGAFAIAFTAARMVLEDKAIEKQFPVATGVIIAISIVIGVAIPLLFWLFNRAKAKAMAAKEPPSE